MNLVFCAFLSLSFSSAFLLCVCVEEWERGDFSFSTRLLEYASFHFFCLSLAPSSTAPHEICKDEHLLSMSWKRASAGETVYNKCPTNATGQSHNVLKLVMLSVSCSVLTLLDNTIANTS